MISSAQPFVELHGRPSDLGNRSYRRDWWYRRDRRDRGHRRDWWHLRHNRHGHGPGRAIQMCHYKSRSVSEYAVGEGPDVPPTVGEGTPAADEALDAAQMVAEILPVDVAAHATLTISDVLHAANPNSRDNKQLLGASVFRGQSSPISMVARDSTDSVVVGRTPMSFGHVEDGCGLGSFAPGEELRLVAADEPPEESFGMIDVGLDGRGRLTRCLHLGFIFPEQIHEFVVGPGLVSHGQDATSGTRGGREVHGPPDSVEIPPVFLPPGSRARTCGVGS